MSTTANRVTNPMKVITGPDTRWSYANVWEPKSINGGTPKYSVSLIIPKSDTKTVAKIKAAIEAAYQEGQAKLKGNGRTVPPLAAIKTPLRDGDIERPDDPAYANAYFIPLCKGISVLCHPAPCIQEYHRHAERVPSNARNHPAGLGCQPLLALYPGCHL